MYPELPEQLMPGIDTDIELDELWNAICAEICDIRFLTRTHNKRTYDQGCRGPLCGMGMRIHGRRRSATGISEKYAELDPIIQYFGHIAVTRLIQAQNELFERIQSA